MSQIVENVEDILADVNLHASVTTADDEGAPEPEQRPFPTDALPDTLAAMVREVSRVLRLPDAMSGSLVLAVVSLTVGRNLSAKLLPGKITRGNLFILIGADSGTGKSECYRLCIKPIILREKIIVESWKRDEWPLIKAKEEVLTKEIEARLKKIKLEMTEQDREKIIGEIAEKRRALEDFKDQLVEPQLIAEDVTTQQLAVLMKNSDETMALLSSDGGEVVSNILGRYNKLDRTDDSLFVKAYTGDMVKVDRVGREKVFLENPCLTVALMLQPDKIGSLLEKSELSSGGYLPRCLLVQTGAEIQMIDEHAQEICPATVFAYEKLLDELISRFRLGASHPPIEIVPEARTLLCELDKRIFPRRVGELRDIKIFTARYMEQACRLALVVHAAKFGSNAGNNSVDADTVRSAIDLTEYFIDEQLAVLDFARQQVSTAQSQAVIKLFRSGVPHVSVRQIQRHRIVDNAQEGLALLQTMVAEGQLIELPINTAGRSTTHYARAPKIDI